MEVSLLTCECSDQQQKHDRQPTGKHGSSLRCDFVKEKPPKTTTLRPRRTSRLWSSVCCRCSGEYNGAAQTLLPPGRSRCCLLQVVQTGSFKSIKSFGPSSDWSALLSLIITVLELARLCLHPWGCGLCNTEELLAYNRSIFSCSFTQRVNKDKEQPQYWH